MRGDDPGGPDEEQEEQDQQQDVAGPAEGPGGGSEVDGDRRESYLALLYTLAEIGLVPDSWVRRGA